MEERFKEFNQAYERLVKWVIERDKTLDDDLLSGRRPGVRVNKEDGSVTYTIGKLQLEGKRTTLNRQQLLLEMSKFCHYDQGYSRGRFEPQGAHQFQAVPYWGMAVDRYMGILQRCKGVPAQT